MEELINDLVDSIKKDKRYVALKEKEIALTNPKVILVMQRYQDALSVYQDGYGDKEELKKAVQTTKKELAKYQEIQEYYHAYHQLQQYLETINEIVYKDISKELPISLYTI